MRPVFLLTLPLVIVAAGCSFQPTRQEARSDLERDLTLATKTDERPVASAIELGRVRNQPAKGTSTTPTVVRRRSIAHRAVSYPRTKVYEPSASAQATRPVIVDVATPNPGAQPVMAIPAGSHELPPGKTITVIPVMSGPTPSPDRGTDDVPFRRGTGGSGMGGSGMGGGGSGMGGDCPGRGISGGRPRGLLY
jgi:hypothetical protein